MRNSGGSVARDLERLFRGGVDVADGELLRRFLAHGDGDAFEAIVIRHGPMVRGVCGRLLRDPHDADDAFQATFLVLARDGRKLRDPGRLASWLYTAARRASLRARSRSARRRADPLPADVAAPEDRRGEWSDVLPILDAELARLPASQRDVLTLCLLGGASEQEAARRLDCPVGTIKSRLSRGRDALRGRLVRRGVAPAVALAASSSTVSFASAVPETLTRAAVAAASAGGPISPAVATLARGGSSMSAKSITLATVLAGGIGLFGGAVAWTADPPQGAGSSDPPSPARRAKDEHLRRIGRALQGHAAYTPARRGEGIFPAQALLTADRKPGLSWRVAILSYLGQEELYKEFHLDEPWDGPHNSQLIPLMPEVYQTPDAPAPPGETRIQAFWGPGAVFNSLGTASTGRGRQISEIVDGLSETAMIGVADAPVTWTEPDDMAFNYPQYLPDLDATDPRGFALLMADGSIRFLPDRPTRPAFLAALLNPTDQVMLDWSRQAVVGRRQPLPTIEGDPSSPSPPFAEPRTLAPTSPTIEARLGRLEEKMDRLLRKLEAAGDPGP